MTSEKKFKFNLKNGTDIRAYIKLFCTLKTATWPKLV